VQAGIVQLLEVWGLLPVHEEALDAALPSEPMHTTERVCVPVPQLAEHAP